MFPVFTIQIGIQFIIQARNSLRGASKCINILSDVFDINNVSFDTIRKWVFRYGLYKLTTPKEVRDDWIFILDHAVEIGQEKVLITLGVPLEQLKKSGFNLKHEDVEVLDIEVMKISNGELIYEKLKAVEKKVGTAIQILSDHGSDLKKGINLYQEDRAFTIYTYDITHKMGSLLKNELEKDEKWNSLLSKCSETANKLRQTNMAFLFPNKQRTKSRYLNIDKYTSWAENILYYQQKGDFSQISSSYVLDETTISYLNNNFNLNKPFKPSITEAKEYSDKQAFINDLSKVINKKIPAKEYNGIFDNASLGKRKFLDKLSWIFEYHEEIKTYSKMITLVHSVEKQIKENGLCRESYEIFKKNTSNLLLPNSRLINFRKKIISFVKEEGENIPEKQVMLGTSDIVESIIGKYKSFSSKCPMSEVGKMILTIPTFTGKTSSSLVKKAMEIIRFKDVEEWTKKKFKSQSILAKRRIAFDRKKRLDNIYEKKEIKIA